MKSIPISILTSLILLSSSCASIVSHSLWPITINSKPQGAKITVTNKSGAEVYQGSTPSKLTLKSSSGFFQKESYKIHFEKEGYDIHEIPIECRLNGWYWGNILIGGFIGFLVVDPLTGAMFKLDKEVVTENLSKSTGSIQGDRSLKVYGLDEIPIELKKHLVRLSK